MTKIFIAAILLTLGAFALADEPQVIDIKISDTAPIIDGVLDEWSQESFYPIAISSALEDDEKNSVTAEAIQLAAQIVGSKIYFAVRWQDDTESIIYRPWKWTDTKYKKSKTRDDMLAIRFELAGDFNRSMVADADYSVDVWAWSAGRSNLIGYADDLIHAISTKYVENAAEYETPSGQTIFIDRSKDEGTAGYKSFKPKLKVKTEKNVESITAVGASIGSIGDVKAKGIWQEGYWYLEMVRELDTGHSDDKAFASGAQILSQVAVFDKNSEEHKSVSEPLLLNIP